MYLETQRLLESLGFQREGTIRQCVRGYHDIILTIVCIPFFGMTNNDT